MMLEVDEMKRQTVSRCLFERPAQDTLLRHLDTQEKILNDAETARFSKKWGFDPVEGKPVDGGQYQCFPVDPLEYVPSFYLKTYAPRKPRPVRPTRDRSPSSLGLALYHRFSPNPVSSAKRKLNWDDIDEDAQEENDENKIKQDRVPVKGDIVVDASLALQRTSIISSQPSSSMPDLLGLNSDRIPCVNPEPVGSLCGFNLGLGLTRCSSSASLPNLSPAPRSADSTPPSAAISPRSRMTQSSIKDYMPLKKRRLSQSKSSPRS